jgi:hypothetical protein
MSKADLDLDGLIGRGRELLNMLEAEADGGTAPVLRVWQQECAAAVNRLSGASKSHWLARAYADAFLVRSSGDRLIREVSPAEIAARIVTVLERAAMSLSLDDGDGPAPASGASEVRFDFVHDSDLRPVLQHAYTDSRRALEAGDFGRSLILSSGILEAIITDALLHLGRPDQVGNLSAWSFDARIAAAEETSLVRGCARLPRLARRYRDLTDRGGEIAAGVTVTERDARVTGQVLRVVMRDLNPGR